ncbi:MAG: trypsin-like peptidase domain-containing protein [Clostridium sp.]|nr:trypsin-like peptidase domain-containing protein [Clostridium sp.]
MIENNNYQQNGNGPKHRLSFTTKIIFGVAGAFLLGAIGGAVIRFSDIATEMPGGKNTALEEQLKKDTYVNDKPLEQTKVLEEVVLENQATKVVEENMAAIVSITSQVETQVSNFFGQTYNQIQQGAGSGIIIGEDQTYYYISTNNHVVQGAKTLTVTFCDDKDIEATVKGTDTTGDLAVITVKKKDVSEDTKKAIKVAKLGNSDSVNVGDSVVAIGNALGLGQSCTVGVVSATNRELSISNVRMNLIQTDAAINAGNSGGALLNMNGEVIGINSAKLVDQTIEGMCYAIPITNAKVILNELMNNEEVEEGLEGYLGLSGFAVTEEESKMYNIPLGVYVREVPEGGAAQKAGVQIGDVVTKLNGVGVATVEALQERATSYKAGTEITLTVERYTDGSYIEKELKAKLMSKKEFGKLEYSKETITDQNPQQVVPDQGNENPGYSDEDYQKWYEYFRDYFNQ